MYKVFINDCSIELVSQSGGNTKSYQDKEQLKDVIKHLESPYEDENVRISHPDLEELWRDFQSLFTLVPAAGGIVKNPKGKILMIYRWEKWDLPKGKVEKGEKFDEAAVREVVEECGIPEPVILRKLPSTFHTYTREGEAVLKETHWYEMELQENPELTPQKEEDITDAQWVKPGLVSERLKDSYASLQWLFDQYA